MSEDYKFQVSVKFGQHDNAMLNIRANSPEELDVALRAVNDASGNLAVCADTVRAVGVVNESFPGTQVVGTTYNTAPAAPVPQPAPAAAGPDYTQCGHGARVKKSGGQGADAWEGWFCPLPKTTAGRCTAVYPNRTR